MCQSNLTQMAPFKKKKKNKHAYTDLFFIVYFPRKESEFLSLKNFSKTSLALSIPHTVVSGYRDTSDAVILLDRK